MPTRHFLKDTDFNRAEVAQIFDLAARLKRERGTHEKPLAGQTWALIFSKSSTRTRVSFEVGI
ncbi:MAG TPA: ornithine carbamoyltransferase, partial [Acidobacteriota bacterium]|nr:ornithine carbamoyltransferase [Acidobacteriota bacterium]